MIRQELASAPEPHEALLVLGRGTGPFLIESNLVGGGRPGRYSFAGAAPTATVSELDDEGLSALPAGAAGYLLGSRAARALGVPSLRFGAYETLVTWDHLRGRTRVTAHGPDPEEAADRLVAALDPADPPPGSLPRPRSPLRAGLGRAEFIDAAARAAESGGTRVLQHFEVQMTEDPIEVYCRFRKTLRDPVTACFGGPDGDVLVSCSGEGFSSPSLSIPAAGVRSLEGEWWLSPIRRTLAHHEGIFRFEVVVPIDRRTDPDLAYRRSLSEARPLAAVLGFRL